MYSKLFSASSETSVTAGPADGQWLAVYDRFNQMFNCDTCSGRLFDSGVSVSQYLLQKVIQFCQGTTPTRSYIACAELPSFVAYSAIHRSIEHRSIHHMQTVRHRADDAPWNSIGRESSLTRSASP